MRSLNTLKENSTGEWDNAEQALREASPEPPPLSQARSRAILDNALAESARPPARRPSISFTSLFRTAPLGYALTGSVIAAASVGLLWWGHPDKMALPVGDALGIVGTRQSELQDTPPQDTPATPQQTVRRIAALIPAASHRESRRVRRKRFSHTASAIRVARVPEPSPGRTVSEPEGVTVTAEATVTPNAIRAYQEAVLAFAPARNLQPYSEEDAPRLLVVVSDTQPELSLAIHNAPASEAGYAEASALHQAADGSLVWERSTLQTGVAQAHFYRVMERRSSGVDTLKPAPQNYLRPNDSVKPEGRLILPEIEETKSENRYPNIPSYRVGPPPDHTDHRFGAPIVRVCAGTPRRGCAFAGNYIRCGSSLQRVNHAERDPVGSTTAGERSAE